MLNPTSFMKIMSAKNIFEGNHPKFIAFLRAVFSKGIEEGTVIEITVTKPGQEALTSNLKIQQSDLELMQELKETFLEKSDR
jgi:hypothetical protein